MRYGRVTTFLVACALVFGVYVHAYATTDAWRVRVRPSCMAAEDSAAHLRLIIYNADAQRARYGCFRKGY